MNVMVGSARIDEKGRAHGGKAGDNNKKEVSTQNWYRHSKGWRVLRPKSPTDAEKIAVAMEAACRNNNIGYDQYQRLTLWNLVKDKGFDPAKADKKCECDCSSLVRVCMAYAGIEVENFRTTNQARVMLKTGRFNELTSSKYTARPDYLKRGDVLVTKTQGHTVVVLNDGDGNEYALGERVLRKGMEGADVGQLQTCLLELGYHLPKYGVDCDFGSETEEAVMNFQAHMNILATGVYDEETHNALMDAMEAQDGPNEEPEPIPRYPMDALDLSQYNTSKLDQFDWKTIERDVGFLILRCGITRKSTKPLGIGPDTAFKKLAEKCNEYDIPFWAYYYSQGKTKDMARQEAEYLFEAASQFNPVGYCLDCEEKGIKVEAFFERLKELGAKKTMLYIGHNWYPVYDLPTDEQGFIQCADAIWIPRYGKNDGSCREQYLPKYPCDLWQYTSVCSFDGIPDKTLDANRITGQRWDMNWFRNS